MGLFVVLDSGPLGMLCGPAASPTMLGAKVWVDDLVDSGRLIYVPEIADYEVRRELLRARKFRSLESLDRLVDKMGWIPISTAAMRGAAELWAAARNAGRPTAGPQSLDGDVILAAQALLLPGEGDEVVVATTNPAHLSTFVAARVWHGIA